MSVPYVPTKTEPGLGQSQPGPSGMAWNGAASQPPADVITIADRRIRVMGGGLEGASLYNYCRQWTYNSPNPSYTGPLDEGIRLPPVHLSEEERLQEAAAFGEAENDVGGTELTDFTVIDGKQKQRWKALGEHMRKHAAERRRPYIQRLHGALRPAR